MRAEVTDADRELALHWVGLMAEAPNEVEELAWLIARRDATIRAETREECALVAKYVGDTAPLRDAQYVDPSREVMMSQLSTMEQIIEYLRVLYR